MCGEEENCWLRGFLYDILLSMSENFFLNMEEKDFQLANVKINNIQKPDIFTHLKKTVS